jgi:hypothetical protein
LSRNEEKQPDVIVAKSDWENFLSSLERLISLHHKTIQHLRDLRIRNKALQAELRSALALPTIKAKPGVTPAVKEEMIAVQFCRFCGRELELAARFCDGCGRPMAAVRCVCGRDLIGTEKFCDNCGLQVTAS